MKIAYIKPLESGIKRMVNALFKPFDLKKWFVVGFTAFLANLMDGSFFNGGGNFGNKRSDFGDIGKFNLDTILNIPNVVKQWILDNPGWFIFIIIIALVIIAIVIVLLWLSSRGKFMFLDNVVHNRSEVAKPWKKFGKQGNSLFLWRITFGLICFAMFLFFIILILAIIYKNYRYMYAEDISILFIVGIVFIFLFLSLITIFITMLVDHFVVPLMYKYDLTTLEAWKRFLPLLIRYFLQFILYALLIFLIAVLVIICTVLIGIFTCCIGCCLLIIPYISAVYTLPISYSFRSYSLEFFAQFGEEFNLFPKTEGEAAIEV
jgi:hypothetical protein